MRAEGRVDLARTARSGRERGEAGREQLERLGRYLAAAKLGEQFLLRRQVEILVRDDRVLFRIPPAEVQSGLGLFALSLYLSPRQKR